MLRIVLLLSALFLASCAGSGQGFHAQRQALLFIGTNDKDTYKPEIPYDTAKARVEAILAKNGVTDFSFWAAEGGWMDQKGVATHEQTLVYLLYTDNKALLQKIAGEACEALNQGSIAIQIMEVESLLFSNSAPPGQVP
jgi:hypothetical protein